MDELNFVQLINGVSSEDFKDHRESLIEEMVNRVADQLATIPVDDVTTLFSFALYRCLADKNKRIVGLCISLMTNITAAEQHCHTVLGLLETDKELDECFQKLVKLFLSQNPQADLVDDLLEQFSGVLCNLCQLEDGRRLWLNRSNGYMIELVKQMRAKSVARRRGAIGCVRSCLFEKDFHWWMVHDVGVLNHLLIPLVVAKPFSEEDKKGMDPLLWLQAENPDKQIEQENDIVVMLLECIVLLCQCRGLREELRKKKVYPIMRDLDTNVDDENISEVLYEAVNFLILDEDKETPIDTYHKK